MKMLMVVCPQARQGDVQALIAKHGVHAYSEFQHVRGEGKTGKHFGTHVWPEESVLIFTVVPDEKKDELVAALRQCATQLYPDEGLRAFVLPVEEAV
jgi:hypothetical protein